MTTWYTSDLHLGHERIIELSKRPFDNIKDMNESIIAIWNQHVKSEDSVFVLGDVAMGEISDSLQLVKRLNGEKFLIPGNHDRLFSGNFGKSFPEVILMPGYQRWYKEYTEVGFNILREHFGIPGKWEMCHFPFEGDSQERDRFADRRPVDVGQWLIHGHVHEKWKVNGRQINVGVDVWNFCPVAEEEIEEIISSSRQD